MSLENRVKYLEQTLERFMAGIELRPYAFGSMYNHDTSTTVTIGATDTPVRVPGGFTQGQANLMTFQNSREIAVSLTGIYKIVWQISFTMAAGANQEIEGFVMINNVINIQATGHERVTTATDTGSVSGNCELDLAAGDVVALGMLNETSTNNIVVEHANLSIDHV